MQLLPIHTRVLTPPQDDLLEILGDSLSSLQSGDVVLISSKVVAIHEGQCVEATAVDKQRLAHDMADFVIPRPYWSSPLLVSHNTFLGHAGIDESNGDGYLVLLPKDPFASAAAIHTFLCATFGFDTLGVVITDSRSQPFRFGATGVAIAWWGMEPLDDHRGRKDLFDREIKVERSNVVDGLAAGATVVMGEVDECVPVVIARDVPRLTFTDPTTNTRDQLFSSFADDTFRVLYDQWLPKGGEK